MFISRFFSLIFFHRPWDFGKFIQLQFQQMNLPIPHEFRHWINVRKYFLNFYQVRGDAKLTIQRMLEMLGMEFEGFKIFLIFLIFDFFFFLELLILFYRKSALWIGRCSKCLSHRCSFDERRMPISNQSTFASRRQSQICRRRCPANKFSSESISACFCRR